MICIRAKQVLMGPILQPLQDLCFGVHGDDDTDSVWSVKHRQDNWSLIMTWVYGGIQGTITDSQQQLAGSTTDP